MKSALALKILSCLTIAVFAVGYYLYPSGEGKSQDTGSSHSPTVAKAAQPANEQFKADELIQKITRLGVVTTDGTLDLQAQKQLAITQAREALALSKQFEETFPADPRLAEVALLRARLSLLPPENGGKGLPAETVAAEYRRIADSVTAPAVVRERASRDWLLILAEEVKSGRMAAGKWVESARSHLKQFPENPCENTAVSTLLAEITGPAASATKSAKLDVSPATPGPKTQNQG